MSVVEPGPVSWELPGGYRVDALIGRGGFASVYKGFQYSLNRPVAIKILAVDLTSEADRRRFEQECTVLARLGEHPHIVDVFDAGVSPERHPFIVMRLYRGGNLAEQINHTGPMQLSRAANIISKIALAVDAAHHANVLHRDIKPANIFLTDNDEPVLGDFGIAKLIGSDDDAKQGHTSTKFFTPAHSAPEILEHQQFSAASDIYALASTAYQLLAGRLAFNASSIREAIRVLDHPVPPIGRGDVPSGVDEALAWAMAKNPAERPQTADIFAQTLRGLLPLDHLTPPNPMPHRVHYQPGRASGAHPEPATQLIPTPDPTVRGGPDTLGIPSPPTTTTATPAAATTPTPTPTTATTSDDERGDPKSDRREPEATSPPTDPASPPRRIMIIAAAVIAVLLTITGFWYITLRPSATALDDSHQDHTNSAGELGFSPVKGATPLGDPLQGHTDSVLGVAFSPDGKILATASGDGTVRLWDAARHQPIGEPLQGHTSVVYGVAFSPDGKILATTSWDGTVRLWDVARRQPLGEPLQGHTSDVYGVAFSPDGKILATVSVDHTVRLWDVARRQPLGEPLQGHTSDVYGVAFSPDGKTLATAGSDHTVRLWDVARRQSIGSPLQGHSSDIYEVVFSPDGKTLATASVDHTVRLWDVARRQPIGDSLQSHTDSVLGVAFSPDGKTLATASGDGTVRLWDVARRQPIGEPLQGHTNYIEGVVFSPDGKTLATTSWDTTVRLWRLLS